MNALGLAAPNQIRCRRAATARPCRGSLRLRGLVVGNHICVRCGQPFHRRGTAPRMYCTMACYSAHRSDASVMTPRKLGRSRALRWFPASPCDVCGVSDTGPGRAGTIHRHHRDGDQANNDPSNIAFLCRAHHTDAHRVMRAQGIGRKSGGTRPRITALLRDRAIERAKSAALLRDAGLSSSEIAHRFDVDVASVNRWFRKYL